jgi:serine/threonine protein kinase
MSETSSLTLSTSNRIGALAPYDIKSILDDIQMEESEVDFPTVEFSQIRVNEIVTDGSFKYYHGDVVVESASDDTQNMRYVAIKCLKTQNFKQALRWIQESKILSNLRHENILNIQAISPNALSHCQEETINDLCIANRYFQVVDSIKETLRHRMEEWKKIERGSSLFPLFSPGKKNAVAKNKHDALGRVKFIGYEIAKVMEYLHYYNVCIGDLSPRTIGFDNSGTVKIIDFSKAKVVNSDDTEAFATDMYSFGLLLWELFTLSPPREHRPALSGVIHADEVREFIAQCWDQDISKRHVFSRRLPKLMLEMTRDCHHYFVEYNKREIGKEYLSLPEKSQGKNFRVSKVNITIDLLSEQASLPKGSWDSTTVGTHVSDVSK